MESALAFIVWLGVAVIGPPALLVWLVRRRRRRQRLALQAAATARNEPLVTASAGPPANEPPTPDSSDGFRFPYGVPLVIYPLLVIGFGSVASRAAIAGITLIATVLAIAFGREAFSHASFEKIRSNDPTMNLATWRINWLLFFAIPPGVLAILGGVRLLMK
ncbi:MAG: hypothetical protein JNM79_18795 [Burkholderiales bacterium]|nr:hypothetical protein [Burkholderiales bacterium]